MAPNLVTLLRDWGVNSAMIKYTAQYRSENRTSKVKSILAPGLSFELVSGFFLSLISFLFASIFNRPETTPLIQVASFTVFAGALLTALGEAFELSFSDDVPIRGSIIDPEIGGRVIFLVEDPGGSLLLPRSSYNIPHQRRERLGTDVQPTLGIQDNETRTEAPQN